MDLFAALAALGRRWYLTLILVVAVIGGTVFAASRVSLDYKATATTTLLPPPVSSKFVGTPALMNPYLGQGIESTALAVSVAMTGDRAVTDRVVRQGGSDNFDVSQGPNSGTPLINIEATSTNPEQATKTVAILTDLLHQQLVTMQSDARAPAATWITASTIASGGPPTALRGSRTRVAVAVGAAGFAVMFGLVLLIDGMLTRRWRTRRRAPQDSRAESPENRPRGVRRPAVKRPAVDAPEASVGEA
jgi:hypothetical protein